MLNAGMVMLPDIGKLILNEGNGEYQKLTINNLTTNEVIKEKADDYATRNAKKWLFYPPYALFASGGLATATIFIGENILEIDDIPSLSAAIITGSSGLVGSYYHFNKLDKMSLKAINPENNILFNETYHKEFKKRKFKNIIASTGLTAVAGTLFFLTTFSLGGDFYFGP